MRHYTLAPAIGRSSRIPARMTLREAVNLIKKACRRPRRGRPGQSVRKRSRPRALFLSCPLTLPFHCFSPSYPLFPHSRHAAAAAAAAAACLRPPHFGFGSSRLDRPRFESGGGRLHDRNMNATKNAPAGASSASFFAEAAGVAAANPEPQTGKRTATRAARPGAPGRKPHGSCRASIPRPNPTRRRARKAPSVESPIFNFSPWTFFPFLSLFLCVFCRHA